MAIKTFKCADTRALFELKRVPRFADIERTALRKLNDRFRICFTWVDANAEEVEIVDYH